MRAQTTVFTGIEWVTETGPSAMTIRGIGDSQTNAGRIYCVLTERLRRYPVAHRDERPEAIQVAGQYAKSRG